jgi:arylsulfatase A
MGCGRRGGWLGALIVGLLGGMTSLAGAAEDRPNIVYILADDLGYGDVRCLNAGSKIATPNIDRLAERGMTFTDAHSGSAVCTPTRYGILTGRYAWRSRLKAGVLGGYSPHLIEPGRMTVASLLKGHGYRTACVGKWHLGLDWPTSRPARFGDAVEPGGDVRAVDYSRPIANGPTALGFDEFFGISASLDMPPYIYIRGDRTVGLPTAERTYIRKGPAHEGFEAVDVLPTLASKAIEFIDGRGQTGGVRPFFLYLALTAPHTPIVPTSSFRDRSGLGPYGDFVVQVDDAVGRVLEALRRNGVEGRTLVFFASDNGCAPAAGFDELVRRGHHPSGPFRGHKADIYEGGHRVPFLARWPGKVRAGSSCDDTIGLTDLIATCAAIVGATLPDDAGEDSVSILPDLLGTGRGPVHEAVVHHSVDGSFAIRQGAWKLALCPGSGGWSPPRPGRPESEGLPPVQLYDLSRDVGERHNIQAEHPEIVARLTKLLERYVADGRSTPGPPQKNEGEVRITSPIGTRRATRP